MNNRVNTTCAGPVFSVLTNDEKGADVRYVSANEVFHNTDYELVDAISSPHRHHIGSVNRFNALQASTGIAESFEIGSHYLRKRQYGNIFLEATCAGSNHLFQIRGRSM